MFHSARVQLTAWYLVIIVAISVLFSFAIYHRINAEFVRFENISKQMSERQRVVIRLLPNDMPPPPRFDLEEIQDARSRLILTLIMINMGICILAGGAGYFLAGKTLRPIQEMVDEQKQFVTDASHELRTPLTALRTEIEVTLRDKKLTLPEARKLLSSNLEEVIHLQSLSDGLLALSVQQKTKQKHFKNISLEKMLVRAVKKIQPQADKKQITINEVLSKEMVVGDESSLTELFVILLDNAVKYSDDNQKVDVVLRGSNKQLSIAIHNKGVGIDKKDIPYIFDRFYRADAARKRVQSSGYGLGLAIARKIVDEHNGTIRVTSDKETIFTVLLPRKHSS